MEQKNFTHVRELVGYHRLQGARQQMLLARLYTALSDWRNFLLPVMRLESKVRQGANVHRHYDEPKTPYQRLLKSGQLSAPVRQHLERRYAALNPFPDPAPHSGNATAIVDSNCGCPAGASSRARRPQRPPAFSNFFGDPTGRRSVTRLNDLTRGFYFRTCPSFNVAVSDTRIMEQCSRSCIGDYLALNNVCTVRFAPSRALSREMQYAPSSKPVITEIETPIEISVLFASAG